MFTGLIEQTARLLSLKEEKNKWQLTVSRPKDFQKLALGESIAVNGCCLTLTSFSDDELCFDLSEETIRVTLFNQITENKKLNLERAMKLSDRLGGHLVSGHVDDQASIQEIIPTDHSCYLVKVLIQNPYIDLIIPKGSICIDGVSLTINNIIDAQKNSGEPSLIELMIIPETWQRTIFCNYKAGDLVHIEFDMLAKFFKRQQSIRTLS